MTEVSKTEKFYQLYDDYSVEKLILVLFIGVSLGFAVFTVLDAAEKTPETELDLSELNQEYRENATCVPPYRDKACYAPENTSENQDINTTASEPVNASK